MSIYYGLFITQLDLFNHSNKTLLANNDIFAIAASLTHLPGFVFLDSHRGSASATYDIVAAMPRAVIQLDAFQGDLNAWMASIESCLTRESSPNSALISIGFVDYDSAAAKHGVKQASSRSAMAGLYDWCVVKDKRTRESWYVTSDSCSQSIETLQALLSEPTDEARDFTLTCPFSPHLSQRGYTAAIERIRDYIIAGDCYQVNYAQQFSAGCEGHPFEAYRKLRDVAPGDFSAYLSLADGHAILSLSPERFLSTHNGKITTQPIKGTRPRHKDPDTDQAIADSLLNSVKDRAENIMITDLLRNDLGKLCVRGSVDTPEICSLHSYENVHHLVSRIEGTLRDDISPGEALIGCSPGGSITGAPKRRAMEIIAELENTPRGAYCGSIFAIAGDGWMESSVAIRTLEVNDDRITCWGGGGIVFDSNADAEYQETFDKVGAFMRALENQ